MIYLLAAALAYSLAMSALHILLANEVSELGTDLKKARHEIRTLKRGAIPAQRKPNHPTEGAKTMKTTIAIDGTTYVPLDVLDSPVKIVVIEGRWNIVGKVETHEDGSLTIYDGKILTYWGTTQGLGELTNGPTDKTKADPCNSVVRVPAHAVLLTFDCADGSWAL